ncbi:hypothetical protein [uncultured Tateyamaria sp.]|uniref:hypothetical protein n=1 Tax=uncultured Tateyamaria sp. TaxID=455651 RepID=UPI002622EE76|nr:hypothetical protein [uncultured Tateyamaria sp.]
MLDLPVTGRIGFPQHGIKTRPQIVLDGERIGGFDDLSADVVKPPKAKDATIHKPVALFSVAALMMVGMALWMLSKL